MDRAISASQMVPRVSAYLVRPLTSWQDYTRPHMMSFAAMQRFRFGITTRFSNTRVLSQHYKSELNKPDIRRRFSQCTSPFAALWPLLVNSSLLYLPKDSMLGRLRVFSPAVSIATSGENKNASSTWNIMRRGNTTICNYHVTRVSCTSACRGG